MTGMGASSGSAFSRVHISYPFISGMLMSSKIKSGGSSAAATSASRPRGNDRTRYPRRLRMPSSSFRLAMVSSTTMMFVFLFWSSVMRLPLS